jgi:hypothetical protein
MPRAPQRRWRQGRDRSGADRLWSGESGFGRGDRGLEVALVQGYKPEKLTRIQTDLDAAGAGLQDLCDAAKKAASMAAGTKGVVSDSVKAAVEPVIGAIKDGLGALWARHIEEDKAEQDSIKGQLDSAKWPDFGR